MKKRPVRQASRGMMKEKLSMLAEQRHQYILSQVARNGALSVAELVRELNVSRETIRRDLNTLADRGLIVTTHGGALSSDRREPDLDTREAANASAKRAIGERAAQFIPDGASVIIDSGSTTQAVARALTDRHRLTVYTNDWRIALLRFCHSDRCRPARQRARAARSSLSIAHWSARPCRRAVEVRQLERWRPARRR